MSRILHNGHWMERRKGGNAGKVGVVFTPGIHRCPRVANKPVVHFWNFRWRMNVMIQMWCAGYGIDIRFSIDGLIAHCRGFGGVIRGRSGSVSALATHGHLVRVLALHRWGNIAMDLHVLPERTWMRVTFLTTPNPTIIRLITRVDMGMLFSVRAVCKSAITSVKLTLKRLFTYKRENKPCIQLNTAGHENPFYDSVKTLLIELFVTYQYLPLIP